MTLQIELSHFHIPPCIDGTDMLACHFLAQVYELRHRHYITYMILIYLCNHQDWAVHCQLQLLY